MSTQEKLCDHPGIQALIEELSKLSNLEIRERLSDLGDDVWKRKQERATELAVQELEKGWKKYDVIVEKEWSYAQTTVEGIEAISMPEAERIAVRVAEEFSDTRWEVLDCADTAEITAVSSEMSR